MAEKPLWESFNKGMWLCVYVLTQNIFDEGHQFWLTIENNKISDVNKTPFTGHVLNFFISSLFTWRLTPINHSAVPYKNPIVNRLNSKLAMNLALSSFQNVYRFRDVEYFVDRSVIVDVQLILGLHDVITFSEGEQQIGKPGVYAISHLPLWFPSNIH